MNLPFHFLAHSVKVLECTAFRSVGMVGLCFEAFLSNNKKDVNLTNFIIASIQTGEEMASEPVCNRM
jgi:hypothetical protein